MFTGYALIAIICFADEPETCERYGLGWVATAEACQAAARSMKLRPPKGFVIRQYACQSGIAPDGRDTL